MIAQALYTATGTSVSIGLYVVVVISLLSLLGLRDRYFTGFADRMFKGRSKEEVAVEA